MLRHLRTAENAWKLMATRSRLPIKRPTSASSTSSNSRSASINQRTRSNSSSASMITNRQISTTSRSSLKTKSTKQINNISTQSNLLGKVDLDDEDDLLTKYQTKKHSIELNDIDNNNNNNEFLSTMNKFNSNIQTMIDSKWNDMNQDIIPER
ncbi:unnamed protein product [Rotaria sp. Silwood2]|nr:unnamed protein product [Rotaria sp. Silwood2]